MGKNTRKRVEVQGQPVAPQLLIFSIAFNPGTNAATFVGNMPAPQAAALLQQFLQSQLREQIRGEIAAEAKQKTIVKVPDPAKEGKG